MNSIDYIEDIYEQRLNEEKNLKEQYIFNINNSIDERERAYYQRRLDDCNKKIRKLELEVLYMETKKIDGLGKMYDIITDIDESSYKHAKK